MTIKPLLLALLMGALLVAGCGDAKKDAQAVAADIVRPALSVEAVTPVQSDWPRTLAATGDIAAWQEVIIGAEIGNHRITEVAVNVGDRVKKGQLLALISRDMVAAEVAQSRAAVNEAEAALSDATANAERARRLREQGFYSAQMGSQYITAEQTARARLDAAKARLKAEEIRLGHTQVVAPDDGVISARTATVGSLVQQGGELFRLIRQGRLEWRAKVAEADLTRIRPGMPVEVTLPDGSGEQGRVRVTAPSVSTETRDGLVYVDLGGNRDGHARAGMFARGSFDLGRSPAMTLPQAAVVARDGYTYVYRLDKHRTNGLAKIVQIKVDTGRRLADRVEVLAGISVETSVVAGGTGFLSDGDLVKIVAAK